MRRPRLFALVLASLLLSQPVFAQQPAPGRPTATDEQALKNAGLNPAGPALVDFLRKRVSPETDADALRALIRQLGDGAADARDRATVAVLSQGPAVIPLLRQAANDLDDAALAARARQCLTLIEGSSGRDLSAAAVRVLAQGKPPGAAEVLLAYLPFAEDDQVADEIGKALAAVAVRDGTPDPELGKALKDPLPVRRALAGEVLCRLGGPADRAAVRELLQDPKPSVRLRLALALADARDAEAVGVLINVLGELPPAQTRQVEEFLNDLAGEWAVKAPQGNDEVARRMRRELWAAWWKAVDGSVLVGEFRKRSLSDADREKAEGLIRALANPAEETRAKAVSDLVALGANVAPLLRQAAGDPKLAQPAQSSLRLLQENGLPAPLPPAAARLLAVRKPAGGVEALLGYLPLAEDDAMAAEIQSALGTLAVRDGRLDPALVQALDDKAPARRAAAAEVICRSGPAADRPAVRKLLKDADPAVRLHAGLALAGMGEREALPVLIALLGELPQEQGAQIEDYLLSAAGEQAPDVALGAEAADRQKCRDAWAAWWRDKGEKVELPRVDAAPRGLGYTVIVEQNGPVRPGGRVWEVDLAGKTRWSIDGLQGPMDAQALPGDRVLIVEPNIQRVSERDLKGKVLWEKSLPNVMAAERLRNGTTFIVARHQLLELDRAGKEVFTYNRPNSDIMAARRLKDGQYAFVTYGWQYTRLDGNGKEQKSGQLGVFPFNVNPCGVDFLPNDHVLVAEWQMNKVAELDLAGKVLWEAAVQGPMSVSRLRNGHTLVANMNFQRVSELDRTGKVVWEYKENNIRPFTARRR